VKRKRQKTPRVDKACAICKSFMLQVHPNTQNCPKCAKANLREQNRVAVAKYREKEPKTIFKSEKRLSYERWRESENKAAEQIDNNMPEIDFTGLPVPTKFDNLFCSIK